MVLGPALSIPYSPKKVRTFHRIERLFGRPFIKIVAVALRRRFGRTLQELRRMMAWLPGSRSF